MTGGQELLPLLLSGPDPQRGVARGNETEGRVVLVWMAPEGPLWCRFYS